MTKETYKDLRGHLQYTHNWLQRVLSQHRALIIQLFHAYHTDMVNETGQGREVPIEAFESFVNTGAAIWSEELLEKVILHFDKKFKIVLILEAHKEEVVKHYNLHVRLC